MLKREYVYLYKKVKLFNIRKQNNKRNICKYKYIEKAIEWYILSDKNICL